MDEVYRQTSSVEVDPAVNEVLSGLLIQYNDRDVDLVGDRLREIESAIEETLETSVELIFGGSVAKHTYVDGLSDIDSLAILRDPELQSLSASEVLDLFASVLKRELGYEVRIREGQMAVTIVFPDGMEIQVLPAIKGGNGIKIPVGSGDDWSSVVRPEVFARKLTERNQENSNRLVPVIKLAKAVLNEIPAEIRPTGYHVESLAVEAFQDYAGTKTYKDMLHYLFERASKLVLSPMKDSTGQSLYVDENLGEANSKARQVLSGVMDRVARRMSIADRSGSSEEWLQAIGE